MAADVNLAIQKLRWSASGVWSASIKPEECQALLDIIDNVYTKPTGTIDKRQTTLVEGYFNEEDDAHVDR